MAAVPPLAAGTLIATVVAFGCLMWSFAVNDTSVANVAGNSHSAKPMLYKLSATWGSHEGSMVLWVLILALCGGAVSAFGRDLPSALKARVLAVLGLVGVGFFAFILGTSNPFDRLWPPPPDGQGLNPVLQDPGLAFHPPLLYLGYVGCAVTFAFAVAALIEGRVDAAWGRWVRPWALAAWSFLTLGIALGSWWAYYELGWGGYWFWDPVENASLLPWLAGCALLHSAVVVEKREALKTWTVFLALLAFGLSLLGTFLVRSGVLNSVHAFANDPTRGVFILGLLMVYVGGGFALFAWRAAAMTPTGVFAPLSREGALVLNNLLLCSIAAVVLAGTLYPMFADILLGQKISVGPPFFNTAILPLVVPLIGAMAVGPLMPWKRARLFPALQRLWWAALGGFAALLLCLALEGARIGPAIGFAAGAWLLLGALADIADRLALFSRPRAAVARALGLAALRLGRGGGACGDGRAHPRHRRHGARHRSAGARQAGRERGTGRLHLAAGEGGGRAGPELHRAARDRDRARRGEARGDIGAGAAELSGGPHDHHGGGDPHHLARGPLRRARRGAGRRGGAPAAPQPAGALDLARRRDHGAGRRAVAVGPSGARLGAAPKLPRAAARSRRARA